MKRIYQLVIKGNFEMNITWQNGEMSQVEILSKNGGPCHLRYKDAVLNLKTVKGKNYSVAYQNGELIL